MNKLRSSSPRPRGPLPRSLALALPLALLALLVVVISANAYVAKRTESTLAEFDSGTFLYTGLLDIPPNVHSVQLLPIGLTGDWQTSAMMLPQSLANVAAVANGDYIYVVGGTDPIAKVVKTVYSSKMGIGTDLAPWNTEAALPEARGGAALAVWPLDASTTILYVVGGFGPDYGSRNTVYRAPLNNDTGVVGAWVSDAQVLPEPLHYSSVVIRDGYLYVIGGSKNLISQSAVYYAPINPDGSLGTFQTTEPLPQVTASSYAVVYEGLNTDTLYVVGGWATVTSTYKVFFTDFLAGGEIEPWTLSDGNLPIHLFAHSGVLVNGGEILLTGGIADSSDPSTGISSTVKAALVDTDNASFRLYDWCLGVPPPSCTIGAWQTGALMPEVRALHASVAGHGNIYVIGGQDQDQDPRNTVFFGTVTGVGGLYSPEGIYLSDPIRLADYDASLVRLAWQTTMGEPDKMGLTIQYRTGLDPNNLSAWSDAVPSAPGANEFDPSPPPSGIRYMQYRVNFTTAVSIASPLLDEVEIYYEVDDPDVKVHKDSGSVISVPLGANLVYTIYYSNTGHYQAPDVVLTETLPENTTYVGTGWQQVGSSNLYTRALGILAPGTEGHVPFEVKVNPEVPPTARHVTNTIEIDFPPMVDALNQTIVDPEPADNIDEFSNPLAIYAITVTKRADPPAGSVVEPGSIINYTIVYTNAGVRAASQAVLTDAFDVTDAYSVVSANPPPDRDGHIWDLGKLSPGQSGQIEISVQLADPMPNDWIVSNQALMHSPEGDPEYTQVLTHRVTNPGPTPLVDLTVTDVRLQPPDPEAGEPVEVVVDVANIGTADAGPFWVELYVKPSPSLPPSGPEDHEGGAYAIGGGPFRVEYTWNPAGLAAGTGASLTFPRPGYSWSDQPFPLADTTYDIYVQIDVAASVPPDSRYWGAYAEFDETNNLVHLTYRTPAEDDGRIFLPVVAR